MYTQGMKPAVFSYQCQQREGAGWRRGGKPLSYIRTEVLRVLGVIYQLTGGTIRS